MPKIDTPQLIVAEPAAKVALAFVPLPPIRPRLAAKFELASIPLPPVRLEPAVAAVLASVPLPQVRPAFDPPPKPIAERARTRAGKKQMVAVRSQTELKSRTEAKSSAVDPAGVVSFLKKLVTPDKKSQARSDEAQADPPSQIQPPQ